MADFSKPQITDNYTNVLQAVRDLLAECAKMQDGSANANVPTGAVRFSTANKRFEKFNGTSWAALIDKYSIDVDRLDGYDAGNAAGQIPVSNGQLNVLLKADTVKDGVVTTGSYPDPAWITSIAGAKVTGNIVGGAGKLTTARKINGTAFDGTADIKTAEAYVTLRGFASGTLVATTIAANTATVQVPFSLDIRGYSYDGGQVWDTQIGGYLYAPNQAIMAPAGLSNGQPIGGLLAFVRQGYLHFWWPPQTYWNGFTLHCYVPTPGGGANRVSEVLDVTLPADREWTTDMSAVTQRSWHSGNFNPASKADSGHTHSQYAPKHTVSTSLPSGGVDGDIWLVV